MKKQKKEYDDPRGMISYYLEMIDDLNTLLVIFYFVKRIVDKQKEGACDGK